jgi:starch-binding outer membrane protein, SusD/RagB family
MKKTIAALSATLALCVGCKDALNAPSQDNVVAGTAQPVQNLVTGVVAQDRASAMVFGYLLYPETEARNSVRIDPNEPRFINELIAVPIDPSDFIGSSTWTGFYSEIRAANQLITSPSLSGLSASDKAATIGFAQMMKALDYIRLIQLRDSLGVPIQISTGAALDPIRTKAAVLKYISGLLDSANTSLAAGSATMPFALPDGFKANGDYTKAANLILLANGLKGMVEVYRGFDHANPCSTCFATAITALTTALAGLPATPTASALQGGPYYQFNPSAPESFSNPMVDNHIFLTDNFVQSIQAGDARSSKIAKSASASSTVNGLQLTYRDPITDPSILSNLTRDIPIVRNAAFYLLRAQAEAETGAFAAATADVNVVRTVEGGLAPYATFPDVATARAAILYEYRYSFIYEGPYHLIALREYGDITKAYVTQAGMPTVSSDPSHSSDPLQTALPIPANELAARNGNGTPQP